MWLRLRTPPDEGSRYHLLDPDGSPVREAFLPGNNQLRMAGRGHAWGLVTDELGVESGVRYRVPEVE